MTTGSWLNSDGLYQTFGTSKASLEVAGEYSTLGPERIVEFELDLSTLGSSAAIISNTERFGPGMIIQEVDVVTRVVAESLGSATLNIGLQKADRSTQLDYDGLVAAIPLASMNLAGETTNLTAGVTYGGALLGTALTDTGAYLTADYDAAAFTAGMVRIRIKMYGYGTISN